jgi:hypothetical protein
MKYTKIPQNTFKQIQLNAGIVTDYFNPATGAIGEVLAATTGGLTFASNPTYEDFGADIDNCPKNTKELKKLTEEETTLTGTLVTVTAGVARKLVGAADIDPNDATHIKPRRDLVDSDFEELWWIGDYSNKNGVQNGGYVAIHMLNTLSTGGFQIKSNDKGKGQFAFTFTAHYSLDNQDLVPYEIYVKEGESESGDYEMNVTSVASSTTTGKTAVTCSDSAGTDESYVYQTGVGLIIPSEGSVLTGSAWTDWDGSTEIASTTGLDIVVAIIDDENKAVHAGKATVTVKEE